MSEVLDRKAAADLSVAWDTLRENTLERLARGEWLDHGRIVGAGLVVLDGKRARIDRVRAARRIDGGIQVRVIHTVRDGELAVCSIDPIGVVEFSAKIVGGVIEPRQEE